MSVRLTGASDDLIEVDGDITEEFQYQSDGENFVAFSDGTLLRIEYTHAGDGIWRITLVAEGSGFLTLVQAPEGDDRNYSDVAELVPTNTQIRWAVHGIAYARNEA